MTRKITPSILQRVSPPFPAWWRRRMDGGASFSALDRPNWQSGLQAYGDGSQPSSDTDRRRKSYTPKCVQAQEIASFSAEGGWRGAPSLSGRPLREESGSSTLISLYECC